ncbi:MAG: L-serine ammonia-lyase, iron-sulfur-dependent subunit beta [Schaedlerella sp.]|nr:L-serine ammonia-lyase, iron-sulfur-dependent subunit beta [Schaedlerella sp.]
MNVFDIIGPIMIGPSSSHTAGAVRLGRIAWKILGETAAEALIELSGSFAQTYQGHGTDKALVAGIMGIPSDDDDIRRSLKIANETGLKYEFTKIDLSDAHPNTVRIHLTGVNGAKASIQGASIGGGNVLIDHVNGMSVSFTGQYNTILVRHYDRSGAIAAVTNFMAYSDVNIGNFRLSRKEKGGEALMMIEIDSTPPEGLIPQLKMLPHVIDVILLKVV